MLNPLAENIWEAHQPLRFVGAEVGCRMTVVRLATGELVLHSPVRGTPELFDAVAALGIVGWIVAPNAFHHLFFLEWTARFPEAQTRVAPALHKKRKDLANFTSLDEVPDAWGEELEVVRLDGLPTIGEYVFFHRPSATLIASDIAFNFGEESPFLTRWFVRFAGRLDELAPTALERILMRDRDAFRASMDKVLAWPFTRVVVAHGKIFESEDAPAALAKGYDWVLER